MTQEQFNRLLDDLVDAAMRIAMFDCDIDNNQLPEIVSAKKEFHIEFKKVLIQRKNHETMP